MKFYLISIIISCVHNSTTQASLLGASSSSWRQSCCVCFQNILGLQGVPHEFFQQVYYTFYKIPESRVGDVVLGLLCMALLVMLMLMKTNLGSGDDLDSRCSRVGRKLVWTVATSQYLYGCDCVCVHVCVYVFTFMDNNKSVNLNLIVCPLYVSKNTFLKTNLFILFHLGQCVMLWWWWLHPW